jgi:DNA (cytosine-5)-methyltransferase 1
MPVATQTEFSLLRQKAGLSIDEVTTILDCSKSTVYRYERGYSKPRKPAIEQLRLFSKDYLTLEATKGFRFIDLFAGIGGLRRGFESIGGECVFTSEWDKYAAQTYLANYSNSDDHIMEGDITNVEAKDIPKHDVLLAGFPCQPFSIAGVSKKNALGREHGFRCEAQGTLFFDVARILEYHMPSAFLLENVKNLVNHDKGRTFRIIRETLENELGYKIYTRVIDAKGFVPQHRERIYIVGFRESNEFTFDNLIVPNPLKGPRLESILHPQDGTEEPEGHYTVGKQGIVHHKYTLTDNLWKYLQEYARKHREKGNGFGFGLCSPKDVARTLSARYYKDGSEILIEQEGKNPRRLTPRECARLMGFDPARQSEFKIPVSDMQAYKQFGNSVVVPVVEAVARHMAPWIEGASSNLQSVMSLGEAITDWTLGGDHGSGRFGRLVG